MRSLGQEVRAAGARVPPVAARPVAWAGTRLLLAFALPLGYPSRGPMLGDVARYRGWADQLAHGQYPTHDATWQYPPGAALVMLVPRWVTHLGPSYHAAFVALMLVADAAVFFTVRRHGPVPAAVWVVGGFLLGPLLLNRFDVVPTAFAVLALAAVLRGDEARAGVHLGVGALVKVWPIVVAAAVPREKVVRLVLGALVTGLVALAVLAATGTLGDATDFLHQQGARGIEIEAVAALPWLVVRWIRGHHTGPGLSYGSYEVHGGPVHVVTTIGTVLTVALIVGFVYALWVRRVLLEP
ncbi:MAG TPA: glycosyltransferase 87 family protein, partial [Mycobacteriales bacterium]|nr:glycosyltransferase 87 family protein [Mycobacteriales bacterium]